MNINVYNRVFLAFGSLMFANSMSAYTQTMLVGQCQRTNSKAP